MSCEVWLRWCRIDQVPQRFGLVGEALRTVIEVIDRVAQGRC